VPPEEGNPAAGGIGSVSMSEMIERIHGFFVEYGWQYDFDASTSTWHSGFRGKSNNFNIFIHLTEDWIIFSIAPFVNAPDDEGCRRKLHMHLLKLNYIINMAKFSLDEDEDVVLTVELPTENLDYSEFSDGLNALSYYADTYYLEILNVAQNPDFVPSTLEQWQPTGPEGDPNGMN
jgi:hypothetical protein